MPDKSQIGDRFAQVRLPRTWHRLSREEERAPKPLSQARSWQFVVSMTGSEMKATHFDSPHRILAFQGGVAA
jgi:hypothetical protein